MCECCKNYTPKRFASLNPFKDIRKWQRVPFKEDLGSPYRELAVKETGHDLQKEIQNLLCDVHEEALAPIPITSQWPEISDHESRLLKSFEKSMGVNKRLASLLTVSALETSRTNSLIMWLTIVIVMQTFAVIALTLCMLPK